MKICMLFSVLCISSLVAMDDATDKEAERDRKQLVNKVNAVFLASKNSEQQQTNQQVEQNEESCQTCENIAAMGLSFPCWQHISYDPSLFSRDSN